MWFGRKTKLPAAGSPAPGIRLSRLDGSPVSLSELTAASPVLLAFYKVSCPVCQFTLPYLDRINTPGKLAVYAVSQNSARDAKEFNREFEVQLPTLLDSGKEDYPASNAFGISSVPTLFLVEQDNTISEVVEGWNKKQIQALAARAGAEAIRQGENVPEWKAG